MKSPVVSGSENDTTPLATIPALGTYTNVILLGWDGVQREHLFELLNRNLMPNLKAFIQTGKMVNITVSDHHTDTKAGWTQILTGYKWSKTNVFGNSYWFNTIPKNYTILERLENYYGPNNIATGFITGKLNQMEIEDLTGTAAIGSPFATYSNQALYANLPSQVDAVSVGDLAEDRDASVVGPLALQFIENNVANRFFAFFHLSDPDHIGHKTGENSIQYEQAIETCDYWLGQIVNKLSVLGLSQKTLIYITPDHGFDEDQTTHSNAPYIFFASNDNNVMRNGDEVDVAATVYYGLGLWNFTFSPALDGYPLQLSLNATEEQHRQAVLANRERVPYPTASISDSGSNMKTVNFMATDKYLAAVYIVVDNRLFANGSWKWSYGTAVTASGSYNFSTANMDSGQHSVQVFSFDEHGANNVAPDEDPIKGGLPAITTLNFYIGTSPPTVPPTSPPTSPPIQYSPVSPSPLPSAPAATPIHPRPSPVTAPTPTPTDKPSNQPSASPPSTISSNSNILTLASIIIIAIAVIAILTYLRKRVV